MGMGRYLLVRLASTAVLLLVVTLIVFALFSLVPGDGVTNSRGFRRVPTAYTMGGSLGHQYAMYVWNLVAHGDLGNSYATREPVTTRLLRAVPVTLSLVVGGLVVFLAIAIPLGILSALQPRSLLDRAATVFVLTGIAAHPLWLGLILSYVFGARWRMFPSTGYCNLIAPTSDCGGPTDWTYHLLLPWLTFGLVTAALYMLMIRSVLMEELRQDYVRTAVAKGAGSARVLRKHVAKNVLGPFSTMIGMNVGIALGGVVFIETAFGLPGLGGIFRRSLQIKDVPMTAGIVLFMTLGIVLLNLIVDLTYAAFDPRIRLSPRRALA